MDPFLFMHINNLDGDYQSKLNLLRQKKQYIFVYHTLRYGAR